VTLLPDLWIASRCLSPETSLIDPFEPSLIRRVDQNGSGIPVLSYGCSSYGYDLRLSGREFLVFRRVPGSIVDPKAFNPGNLEATPLCTDENGDFFVLPGHSYGLGVALEYLRMPDNVTGVCLGKSTYARCGIIVNTTPAEAGWEGHLTLEFSNSSGADVRLYVNEGICQILFYEGAPCRTTYGDRFGKYQRQGESVITARV